MSRRSQKFSAYGFDEDDVEKHSRQTLKKFYPTSPKKTATRDAPLDKYTFLTRFSKDKKDQDKKCGHDLVDIDPAIEVEKICTIVPDVEKICTSTDCLDNHSARCCLPKVNSYSSRGLKIGMSTSSNCRDDTNHNFSSETELIGITSDDDNDSTELNSTLRSNRHFVDDEELSTEEVLVGGVNTGESDMEIALLPKYILNGDKKFLNPRLTFSGSHVKLEVGGSILSSGPLSCVWTVSEIFSIESWWFERHSMAALLLHLKSKDTELGIIAEEPGIVRLNWKVTHPCWPKIQDKIWALNVGYKYTWKTNSYVALNTEDVLVDKVSVHPTHGIQRQGKEVMAPPIVQKRGYVTWNSQMDHLIISTLFEQIADGNKGDGDFKSQAYQAVVDKLRVELGISITIDHVKNRIKVWKRHYATIMEIRTCTKFKWDEERKMVVISIEDLREWKTYCEDVPQASAYQNKSIKNWDDICTLFASDRAIGDGAEQHEESVAAMEMENEATSNSETVSGDSNKRQKRDRLADAVSSFAESFRDFVNKSKDPPRPSYKEIYDVVCRVPDISRGLVLRAVKRFMKGTNDEFEMLKSLPDNDKVEWIMICIND